ncbi:hypothetical protein NQ317_010257 [Molorchus minor]|uniref:Uncharacterized protein n=1 Tax=Molorchus minor TaxID=1323400 RepID=A0ABQ9JEB5_9CUCU|nr:hypothetical protein NQ317_010257 [Molorchus minor]
MFLIETSNVNVIIYLKVSVTVSSLWTHCFTHLLILFPTGSCRRTRTCSGVQHLNYNKILKLRYKIRVYRLGKTRHFFTLRPKTSTKTVINNVMTRGTSLLALGFGIQTNPGESSRQTNIKRLSDRQSSTIAFIAKGLQGLRGAIFKLCGKTNQLLVAAKLYMILKRSLSKPFDMLSMVPESSFLVRCGSTEICRNDIAHSVLCGAITEHIRVLIATKTPERHKEVILKSYHHRADCYPT